MIILGLNAFHADSAACLIVDGRLVAAAEEERFRRIKHWAGLPTQAIDYCLREVRLKWSDVDHIAINRKPGINMRRRLSFVIGHRPQVKLMWRRVKNARRAAAIKEALAARYRVPIKARVHHIEHPLAHLASAYFVSGFDEAACLSIDGFGDFTSTAFGFGQGKKLTIENRVFFPHSLAVFYSALTQFLGFVDYGDEDKTMALAAYGEPAFLEQMRDIVLIQPDGIFRLNLKYFRHHTDDVFHNWRDCAPEVKTLFREPLLQLLGPARKPDQPLEQKHKNIARSVQTIYEKAFFEMLHALHKSHPSDHLALAGSCAINVVANGKICRRTPFKKVYVPAAPGDAGGAIGAALVVHFQLSNGANKTTPQKADPAPESEHPSSYNLQSKRVLKFASLGPAASEQELYVLLDWKRHEIAEASSSIAMLADEGELLRNTAQALADGKIVGWFQGRMEWGANPLGNRCILADPRRADMKQVFDTKLQRPESLAPAALSILREAVPDWFEQEDDVPFMSEVFQIRPKHRALIPAVAHVDGSGRLHSVDKETNPRYYRLLELFNELTGVPVLLAAPFYENETLVCYPEEALDLFLRTKMDVLVLENFFINRLPVAPSVRKIIDDVKNNGMRDKSEVLKKPPALPPPPLIGQFPYRLALPAPDFRLVSVPETSSAGTKNS